MATDHRSPIMSTPQEIAAFNADMKRLREYFERQHEFEQENQRRFSFVDHAQTKEAA